MATFCAGINKRYFVWKSIYCITNINNCTHIAAYGKFKTFLIISAFCSSHDLRTSNYISMLYRGFS
jgi:hypothetical protein